MNKTITFELTVDQANIVLESLYKMPYQAVAGLIAEHAFGDVLVASNLDDLLIHVDGVSPATHIAVEVAQREAMLSQRLTALVDISKRPKC